MQPTITLQTLSSIGVTIAGDEVDEILEKLNQMLDEEKPVAGRKRKFWLSFSVAASLIILATILFIFNGNTNPIYSDEIPQIVSNHSNNETETNSNTEVQEPEILVVTKEEISKSFNIPIDKLIIKD